MTLELPVIARVAAALVVALLISFISTPVVKSIAQRVGAMDIPKDNRRMHHHPIPRMGGLAIFLGFLLSALIFVPMDQANRGMLLGAVVIVILGIFDDIYALPALPKLLVQIGAALIAVLHGNVIEVLSNPNLFSENPYWSLGSLAIPLSVIWIVAITNAVNLIDGLDGLAVGVATISSLTMLVIAMLVSEGMVALMMAALAGGCIGFMPYNMNPAKIFMGDTGSLSLGAMLAVISIALRVEWTLLLIGVVYVLETASVMLQVSYFKYTKRKYGEGRRIFRMTPFHHHLELGGISGKGEKWSEWKVDAFLWTIGALASSITLWMVLGNVMK